jgi:NadR type nicotinamide-nucleotide adenylyltransferase
MRGLVIGKFYPPHLGHAHLIETARTHCGKLTVIVCATPAQRPSGAQRAGWLRELHPGVEVLLAEDLLDGEDSQGWARFCRNLLGFTPDVVCTSEEYGARFAHFLGCPHVLVDQERRRIPVSGTKVRANPFDHWAYIAPPVRAYYAKRIAIVGAESTGKTTLAQDLAAHYATEWVPEFGRAYAEEMLARNGVYHWTSADFDTIARTQCAHEEAAARRANKILICDTDVFATTIWHRRYMGAPSPQVEALAATWHRPDLYLLSDVNTPFIQDGTRDGEALRAWMHQTFIEDLTAQGRPFELVTGPREARLKDAVGKISHALASSTPPPAHSPSTP